MSFIHSPETIASVARYAESGMSGSQIAAQFEGMTRNVVIGIANRNKIQLHGTRNGKRTLKKAMAIQILTCELVAEEVPTSLITFEQLTPMSCRWPIGFRDYMFCGKPKLGSFPYCAGHCRLAYNPR